jgi:hypothetical protein
LSLALLGLALLATLFQQVIRPAGSASQGSSQRFDLAGASPWLVHDAANPDLLTIRLESDLIARLDTDLVPNRLGNHDLALDAYFVSHTVSITLLDAAQ